MNEIDILRRENTKLRKANAQLARDVAALRNLAGVAVVRCRSCSALRGKPYVCACGNDD